MKRSTERDSGKSWCSGHALKHQALEPVELQSRTPGPLVSYTIYLCKLMCSINLVLYHGYATALIVLPPSEYGDCYNMIRLGESVVHKVTRTF